MFKNHLKIAWQYVFKQRLVSMINIGSLSIAMSATVMIAIWIQNELSFDSYHTNADRIYFLKNNWQIDKNPAWIGENNFYPLGEAIQQSVPEAETVTRMDKIAAGQLILVANGSRFKEDAAIKVDSNWFNVFSYTFITGNAASFYTTPHSIILTASRAKKIFNSTDIAGKQVQIDSVFYNVAGVVTDNPANSSFQFDVILPFYDVENYIGYNGWLYQTCRIFAKLKPDVNVASAQKKINSILKTNSKADGAITISFLPLKKMRFENDFDYSAFKHVNSKTVTIFSVLAFLLLLTASFNYVNLSVARAGIRTKEMSVRKINGASRLHLFLQMMTESVLTSFIALLLAIVIIYACFPILKSFSGTALSFDPFTSTACLILVSTFLSIILLTGIYPALLLSSFKPVCLFSGTNFFGIKNSNFKKSLITGQFALAVFMITAAIIIYQQLSFIQKQDVAYNRTQVFKAKVPESAFPFSVAGNEERQQAVLATLKQELLAISQVKNVSRTNISSIINEKYMMSGGVDWDGKPETFTPDYTSYSADADINNIMQFTMVAGRWFDKKNIGDKNNTVLNETAVKKFSLQEPIIGKRFNKGVIIGVVKDFFHRSLHEKIGPLVIETGLPNSSHFLIQAKEGHAKEVLEATEKLWKKYFPGTFFEYSFADEDFAALYKADQKALHFTLIFSGLSVLICCIGMFGMSVFMAEQRRKEIGIRKVLGATVTTIALLFSKDFLRLVGLSIVLASPVAWWAMTKWLQDFEYRISISWWMFLSAAVIAFLIAAITVSFEAIKAAIANPVKSLRTE